MLCALHKLLALAVLAAHLASGAASAAEPLPLGRLRDTPGGYTLNSRFVDPVQLVIRDDAAWRAAWGQLGGTGEPPTVDFSRSMAVVAALGRRTSGGFTVRIESVEIGGPDLVVTVTERAPSAECIVSAALTAPADVVIVPRSDAAVRFRFVRAPLSCGG